MRCEEEESSAESNLKFDYKKCKLTTDEWSDLDKQLLHEEVEDEKDNGALDRSAGQEWLEEIIQMFRKIGWSLIRCTLYNRARFF